jgi:regulator of protease activity HflC (stomatin/prohibitin superfamily)
MNYISIMKIKFIFKIFFLSLIIHSCLATVPPGKAGLSFKPYGGGLDSEVKPPGTYWTGMTEEIITYNLQWQPYREKIDVITRDDLLIDVIVSITIRPIFSQVYNLHKEVGVQYYEHVVKQDFRTSVRNAFTAYPMIQVPKNTASIVKEIKNMMNEKLTGKHIEIGNVNIDDIAYSKSLMDVIQNKIAKEQELETMKFELSIAKKDNEIARLKAQRDAEIQVIKAKAEAESLRLVNSQITTKYIQLKAMENPNNKIIYLPIGKDGLPMLLNLGKDEDSSINSNDKSGK